MSSYVYNLAERLDTWLFQEALKGASEQCAGKVGDITAAFILLLFNLHCESGDVFVLWSNAVKDTPLATDLFVSAFFPHKDIISWLEVFGLYFHRRGSERKVKVSTTYKGIHVELLIGLIKQIDKQVLKQLPLQVLVQSTCRPSNEPAKSITSTINQSCSSGQSKTSTMSDAACQCNLPCLDCADGAKRRKTLTQRIRRYKKKMEETQEE